MAKVSIQKFFRGYLQSLLPDRSKEQAWDCIFAKTLLRCIVEAYGLKTMSLERVQHFPSDFLLIESEIRYSLRI
jgi:hypothetical protein